MRESLAEFVAEYAARGKETAIAYHRGYRMERWSYARIGETAFQFARELEQRGIGKGDAMLLHGEASAEWLAAFWGCVLRGVIVVPVDAASTPEFLSRIVEEVQPKLVLQSRETASTNLIVPLLPLESLQESIEHHSGAPYSPVSLTRKDILEIIFTSGTTAEPCGVMISHGNVLANLEPLEHEIKKYLRYEKIVHPLRFLNLLPLSHVFGQFMGIFIPPLLSGMVFFTNTLKPSELLDTIRRERVSVAIAVPRVIESLQREVEWQMETDGKLQKFRADFTDSAKEHFLRRWWRFRSIHRRFGWKFWAFISGGATLPSAVEEFWTRLGYAVIQGYGMTETASLITLNHPFQRGKGSIGKTFPGVEMRLSDEGEILVRGENVAAGYRQGQRLDPVMGLDGWFPTGDLAELGSDGRVYFKGRRKNVIVTPAGMNVYPEDLEAALRKQHEVKDCVVVGLEQDGNAEPCAALLLNDSNADVDAMIRRANQSLAEYQQIRRWFVWPEPDFPRTPTHKPVLPQICEAARAKFGVGGHVPERDSLASLLARITGHAPAGGPDAVLQLSSLDRVELLGALEDRYQVNLSDAQFSDVATLGQLEKLLQEPQSVAHTQHAYPRWPQNLFFTALRLAVYYALTWPATYLLGAPRISGRENLRDLCGPVLVVSNHVTDVDIAWILAALPVRFRYRLATAMGGERLTEFRHPPRETNVLQRLIARLSYFLVVTLFNVFPLPRASGFTKSFSFAGDLADRGWSILIFPEGATTQDGTMLPFRSGIGLLATRLSLPVVPIRLDGLFPLKQAHRKIACPGQVRVIIGKPVLFLPEKNPAEIAQELQKYLENLRQTPTK